MENKWLLVLYISFLICIVGCDNTAHLLPGVEITPVSDREMHGEMGYLIEVGVHRGIPENQQAVGFRIDNWGRSTPIFVRIAYSNISDDLRDILIPISRATTLGVSTTKPANTPHLGGILVGSGDTVASWFVYVKNGEPASCKVVINTHDYTGMFLDTIAKPAKVIHIEAVVPATVTEIAYYQDENFTQPITESVTFGDTIYTKVVFSKDVRTPTIIAHIGRNVFRYRLRTANVPVAQLQSGDAQPYQNDNSVFLCKYRVQAKDIGTFHTSVNNSTGSQLNIRTTQNFIGKVYAPTKGSGAFRNNAQPEAGVTVTIMSGVRSGERTTTNAAGQYIFPNIPGDNLHLRVEKEGLEPKEVLVYRDRPTALPNAAINYQNDPQNNPGAILMGHVWADEVRFIFEETVVINDLLYFRGENPTEHIGGLYYRGIVIVYEDHIADFLRKANADETFIERAVLSAILHEIAHAHQHAVTPSVGFAFFDHAIWEATPEGRAFIRARQKDKAEGFVTTIDTNPTFAPHFENAAEIAAQYWGERIWDGEIFDTLLERDAPNRLKWAKEWLPRK